jgi:hypothetical protein
VTGGARPSSRLLIHPDPEVCPSTFCYRFVAFRYFRGLFLKDVEQNEKIIGPPIENAEQAASVVTAQFSQLTFYLTGVGKRQRRIVFSQIVQAINLQIQRV